MGDKLETFLYVCTFGGVCGGLSYGLNVYEGRKFKFGECVLHILISAVAGWITFQLAISAGVDQSGAGGLCGVSGFLGAKTFQILEAAIRKRMNITKEDL